MQNGHLRAGLVMVALAVAIADGSRGQERPEWDTTVAAGVSLTRGNSRTMLLNGSVITERKGAPDELKFGAEANYGETEVTDTNGTKSMEANVQNARGFADYRRLLTARDFAYLGVELRHDDIAGLDYRLVAGPGVGRYWLKGERQRLMTELGAAYVREKQAGDTDDRVVLRLAERYEWKLSATAKLWEAVEYLPALEDFERYLLNGEIGIEAAVNTRVSLRLVAQDKYNSEPAPGSDANDLLVIGALTCKL